MTYFGHYNYKAACCHITVLTPRASWWNILTLCSYTFFPPHSSFRPPLFFFLSSSPSWSITPPFLLPSFPFFSPILALLYSLLHPNTEFVPNWPASLNKGLSPNSLLFPPTTPRLFSFPSSFPSICLFYSPVFHDCNTTHIFPLAKVRTLLQHLCILSFSKYNETKQTNMYIHISICQSVHIYIQSILNYKHLSSAWALLVPADLYITTPRRWNCIFHLSL